MSTGSYLVRKNQTNRGHNKSNDAEFDRMTEEIIKRLKAADKKKPN